jgi:hypothetical protein
MVPSSTTAWSATGVAELVTSRLAASVVLSPSTAGNGTGAPVVASGAPVSSPESDNGTAASTAMSKVPWSTISSPPGPGGAGSARFCRLAAAPVSSAGETSPPDGFDAAAVLDVSGVSLLLCCAARRLMEASGSDAARAAADVTADPLGGPATTGLVANAIIAHAPRSTPRRGAAFALKRTILSANVSVVSASGQRRWPRGAAAILRASRARRSRRTSS